MIPTVVTGDVAQLVERLNGIQKVRGSIPLISTKKSLLESEDFFHLYKEVGHMPLLDSRPSWLRSSSPKQRRSRYCSWSVD